MIFGERFLRWFDSIAPNNLILKNLIKMTANKQIICIISAMFGAMCIESTGIYFWIAIAMILVPAWYIIKNAIAYERAREMCENPDYLIDLSTYSYDELNEYTELMD